MATWTWTGTGSANSKTLNAYIDGIFQGSTNGTAASGTFSINTLPFQNGNHNVCITGADNVAGTTYTGTGGVYTGAATEWCRTVNFQNGAVPSGAVTDASSLYLAPGATSTLTAQTLNTDGSTTSSTVAFSSANTAIATVNSSTGLITAVASGSTQINATSLSISGADLTTNGSNPTFVTSASHPFTSNQLGATLNITGGAGWTAGSYQITGLLGTTAVMNTAPAAAGVNGGQFSTGPNRQVWIYVWPTNTLPHFATNGTILGSYNPATSFVPHCMFQSIYMFYNEQPYNPGALADLNAGNLNCFELGMTPSVLSAYTSASSFQGSINSYIAQNEAFVAGYPNFHFGLTGDNVVGSGADLYAASESPQSQYSPPAFQYAVQQWTAQGNVVEAPMIDENAVAFTWQPLAGPISYSNSDIQSWLQSITAASGTCTATTNFGWSISEGNGGFIIHGSAVANMNSVAPAVYTASPGNHSTAGTFTFACAGVASGTYNSSNDASLVLEPLGNSWYNFNTDYIPSDAFARIANQAHAVPGAFGLSYPILGASDGNTTAMANWNANSSQSRGTTTQVADVADIYWPHGTSEPYMVSRLAANSILRPGDLGYELKTLYGTYSPSVPLVALTQGTLNYFGLQGYPVPVASCSGNTITFASPHGVANILPGFTRLYPSGATDTGGPADSCNGNFYVYSCPTALTCTVALAATDFTSTGNSERRRDHLPRWQHVGADRN